MRANSNKKQLLLLLLAPRGTWGFNKKQLVSRYDDDYCLFIHIKYIWGHGSKLPIGINSGKRGFSELMYEFRVLVFEHVLDSSAQLIQISFCSVIHLPFCPVSFKMIRISFPLSGCAFSVVLLVSSISLFSISCGMAPFLFVISFIWT